MPQLRLHERAQRTWTQCPARRSGASRSSWCASSCRCVVLTSTIPKKLGDPQIRFHRGLVQSPVMHHFNRIERIRSSADSPTDPFSVMIVSYFVTFPSSSARISAYTTLSRSEITSENTRLRFRITTALWTSSHTISNTLNVSPIFVKQKH